MKSMKVLALSAALASAAFGATASKPALHGDYVEARTADVFTGPCFGNAEVNLMGDLAAFGWRVSEGQFDGVDLKGLGVVGVVMTREAAHELVVERAIEHEVAQPPADPHGFPAQRREVLGRFRDDLPRGVVRHQRDVLHEAQRGDAVRPRVVRRHVRAAHVPLQRLLRREARGATRERVEAADQQRVAQVEVQRVRERQDQMIRAGGCMGGQSRRIGRSSIAIKCRDWKPENAASSRDIQIGQL